MQITMKVPKSPLKVKEKSEDAWSYDYFNQFHANGLFLYPLKLLESL